MELKHAGFTTVADMEDDLGEHYKEVHKVCGAMAKAAGRTPNVAWSLVATDPDGALYFISNVNEEFAAEIMARVLTGIAEGKSKQ